MALAKRESRFERNPLEVKHTGGQQERGSSHKLKPMACACFAGRCPLGVKLTRQTLGFTGLLSRIQRNSVEEECTGSQDGGGTGHKLNSPKCVCFAGRCLLNTYRGEVYPSYTLIEQGRWQSLY